MAAQKLLSNDPFSGVVIFFTIRINVITMSGNLSLHMIVNQLKSANAGKEQTSNLTVVCKELWGTFTQEEHYLVRKAEIRSLQKTKEYLMTAIKPQYLERDLEKELFLIVLRGTDHIQTLSLTRRLQKCETMHLHCFSHPV